LGEGEEITFIKLYPGVAKHEWNLR